jgi:predicted amidohydrolase
MNEITVAVAQPLHTSDANANLQRTIELIREAGQQGARLLAFPETWLPGYPSWLDVCRDAGLWDHAPVKAVYRRHYEQSLTVPGREVEAIARAAAESQVVVVIGIVERVASGSGQGTLYNSLLTIGADGALLNHHRKLMPTFTERLVWGPGHAEGVRAVDTEAGRVGGLICWEHWMPLARQAMHESGEQIHVAAWPHLKEMNLVASRHYAFEGRCFVLCCNALTHCRQSCNPIRNACLQPKHGCCAAAAASSRPTAASYTSLFMRRKRSSTAGSIQAASLRRA